ncbi:MAG: NUDIX domain-containing protein [Cryomorphaceae bacterium]|nr:NUDIX domain-containing protein [Cryomorphaceae bacterium]
MPEAHVKGLSGRSSIALICKSNSASRLAVSESITMTQKYDAIAMTAAGGWVENENREVLWIYRLDHWDLPKGKLETGENIEDCALREVEEECGLSGLILGEKLTKTVHKYHQNGVLFEKTTHWFRMRVKGVPALTPQTEEGIEWVRWVSEASWKSALPSSYDTIQEVATAAIQGKGV